MALYIYTTAVDRNWVLHVYWIDIKYVRSISYELYCL